MLAELSPELRGFLEAQLAAGNAIQWVGGSYPAPPVGASIMLAGQLAPDSTLPEGLRRRDHNSSLYATDITDQQGHYFILTPPVPPPELPSMDEIRARINPTYAPPLPAPTPGEDWIELDIRGETILYYAEGRRTSVTWTYTRGHHLYRSSLEEWFDPETRRLTPIGTEEGDRILARIAELARPKLGTANVIISD